MYLSRTNKQDVFWALLSNKKKDLDDMASKAKYQSPKQAVLYAKFVFSLNQC